MRSISSLSRLLGLHTGLFIRNIHRILFRLRRPVRIAVERFDDMAFSGNRHPFRIDYKVAASSEGRLLDLHADMISNCGFSLDLSVGVTGRSKV